MAHRRRRGPPRRSTARPARPRRPDDHPERLAWYAGLAVMVVLEVVEWPLAVVIAVGHEIAHRARKRAIRELAEGIEAGA